MTRLDFSPLFRSTVGFDRMMNLLESTANVGEEGYPPYNIEKVSDDDYRITMAVAGFGAGDIEITAENGQLVISGKIEKTDDEGRSYLHRGIATRSFERRFDLADHIRVDGASLENGLLHVAVVREVPEAMKPRKIEIGAGSTKAIESKQAA